MTHELAMHPMRKTDEVSFLLSAFVFPMSPQVQRDAWLILSDRWPAEKPWPKASKNKPLDNQQKK